MGILKEYGEITMGNADLVVAVFNILRENFFDRVGQPKEYRLRDKRNTQDDPLDEHIHKIISENLKDAICERSSGPLISPDMAVLRPELCNNIPKQLLNNDLSRIVAIEVKKLERAKGGSIARPSGLDYNTTPPCGTVTIYDKGNSPLDIRGFYLFVCQESTGPNTYKLTALAFCDGNVLNEDFELYRSIVGRREKTIGLGTYGDGADRNRPMLIFPNPLGASELDRAITLIHPDEHLSRTNSKLCLVYRLIRSYKGKGRMFYCYRNKKDITKAHRPTDLKNPFPNPTREIKTQPRGRFRLKSISVGSPKPT